MSISGQNLSIVIVTLKSDKVIHDCIRSIKLDIPIIVIENSNNIKFKKDLESQYKNVECILTNSNLGMGAGNNIGIKKSKTNYVMILNPDVILEDDALDKIFLASKEIQDFSILAPISSNEKYPNFKIQKEKEKKIINKSLAFKVDYVDGFAMLLDKRKFKDNTFFDENIFLYLENDDLCFRVNNSGGNIFIIPNSKINHLGSKAVDSKYNEEIKLSRNWHWLWSKFYFNKKNFGILKALKECLPTFISSILRFLFYLIINNKIKRKKYFNRASGFFNAFLGRPSWHRPVIKD